jgi:DNA-directed RNA polymerase subunit L
MAYFKLISFNNSDNILEFELNNNNSDIDISLANAIRRIVLSELNIIAVDKNRIKFNINDTYLNNDFLSHRLELIPIHNNILNFDKIKFTFNKTNNTDQNINVYVKDFIAINIDTQENIINFSPNPNILLSIIKPNKSLDFEFFLIQNIAKNSTSAFTPVSCISYHFKHDDNKINKELTKFKTNEDKNKFRLTHSDKLFLTNDNNLPLCFIFKIESLNIISTKDIIPSAINVLINKLNKFITNIQNEELVINRANISKVSFDIHIHNEDDTLGNILQSYLYQDKDIEFVGYDIPHPLYKIVLLRIALHNNNDKDHIKNTIINNINNLISLLNKLNKDYTKNIL